MHWPWVLHAHDQHVSAPTTRLNMPNWAWAGSALSGIHKMLANEVWHEGWLMLLSGMLCWWDAYSGSWTKWISACFPKGNRFRSAYLALAFIVSWSIFARISLANWVAITSANCSMLWPNVLAQTWRTREYTGFRLASRFPDNSVESITAIIMSHSRCAGEHTLHRHACLNGP